MVSTSIKLLQQFAHAANRTGLECHAVTQVFSVAAAFPSLSRIVRIMSVK
jgi:hypothetical protein